MKRYSIIVGTCLLAIGFMACEENEELTPTERPEFGYSVPQGNHEYDGRIVEWNERCNTFILYKFDMKELYWSPSVWLGSEETENDRGDLYTQGLVAEVADTNYISEQLDLIEERFLNFYPDSTLRRCLPLKLLLCKTIRNRDAKGTFSAEKDVYSGYDCLAFNWGNENVRNMTKAEINAFKNNVNNTFIERLVEKSKIIIDASFYDGMNYEDAVTTANMYERGFLNSGVNDAGDDLDAYLKAIVQTPYAELIAEPEDGDISYRGILHEKKDVNGFIKTKYEVIVNGLLGKYGIDLQAIGDATLSE